MNCRWLIVLSCFLLTSCQELKEEPPVLFKGREMTIDYHLTVGHPLSSEEKSRVESAIGRIFSEIDGIYNKWNPESEISKINKMQAGVWQSVSPELYSFLLQTEDFVKLTDSLFDPTVEPLQNLWKERLNDGLKPTEAEIASLMPAIGWHKNIVLNEGKILKKDGRTQIDLGGIAKGHAVDLMIKELQQEGFSNLFFEWGGEIKAVGTHPTGRDWRAYIARLENSKPSDAVALVDLKNQSLATSGDYFQYWNIETPVGKKTFCHIFDPKKGTPIEIKMGSIASATILSDSCIKADALAKVLMLFDTQHEAEKWFQNIQKEDSSLTCWILTR